ncbi:MAG: TIGR03086 family protein, partial [Actinobacteria bacterium]|nr:TIGR03086 family protein [Actinomycetota bacterium]
MAMVDFGPAARRLAGLIGRTADDELGRPTPCPAYTLGDLIEHVGGMAIAFAAAARKERGPAVEENPPGDAARLEDGWRTRIPRDLAALGQAWQEPGAWEGMSRIAGMDTPAGVIGLVLADELAVHGWDVARATGQPYACEPELLDAARSFL